MNSAQCSTQSGFSLVQAERKVKQREFWCIGTLPTSGPLISRDLIKKELLLLKKKSN